MKANNVINRMKKLGKEKKRKKEIIKKILLKRILPFYDFCKVVKKDLEAKEFIIAKQKEDTKKMLEMIKKQTIKTGK